MKRQVLILPILFFLNLNNTSAQGVEGVFTDEPDIGLEGQFELEEWPTDLEIAKKENKKLSKEEMALIESLAHWQPTYKKIIRDTEEKKAIRHFTDPFRVIIKKDSVLYTNEKKPYSLPRDIYAYVTEETKGGYEIYILDKDQKIAYRTINTNIIPIEDDLQIMPTPSTYREYPKREAYALIDTSLQLENFVNAHLEYIQDDYLKDLFVSLLPEGVEVPESFTAIGKRLEYKVFYKWQIPIEFGINLNYQEGSWQGDASGLIWRSMFFGPVAQYTFYNGLTYDFNVQMSYQQSLFYKANSLTDNFSFSYSTNALEFNLNALRPTPVGKILFGLSFRRAKASLKDTTVTLKRNPERGNMDSVSILLGYNFDLEFDL